jgi:O-antigen ligase
VLLAAVLGVGWVGVQGIVTGFEVRGIRASRVDLWTDAIRMLPAFPWLGAGFNAFGTAYLPYQNFWRSEWVGQVHDEYLQALLDTGAVGAGIVTGLLFILFRRAVEGARASSFSAALLCSVLAQCVHNLVNPNWQIPANAATFAALAALAVQPSPAGPPPPRRASDPGVVREK